MKRLASLILACALTAQVSIGHCAEETSAKKGPLRLTLTLYSTKIRAKESIWFKIKLTNISKKDITITDRLFDENIDFQVAMKYNQTGFYTFLSIRDPSGNLLEWESPFLHHGCHPNYNNKGPFFGEVGKPVSAEEAAKIKAVWAQEKKEPQPKERRLKPGESLTTRTWRAHGACQEESKYAAIAGYAELRNLEFNTPGIYKVKATYDQDPGEETRKEFKKYGEEPFGPESIRLETKELSILVTP
ncbi:MAG: hypothetical protein AAB320_08955 [Elusimicrobiota bacterium]